MKKILFGSALALMTLVSCNKELENSAPADQNLLSFVATTDGADTRTLVEGTKNYWNGTEQIRLFDGVTSKVFEAKDVEKAATATFVEVDPSVKLADTDYLAIYPAGNSGGVTFDGDLSKPMSKMWLSGDQTAVEGSFDPDAHVAVAFAPKGTRELAFKNVVSLLKFTVGNDNVSEVCFFGADTEYVTGNFNITYNGEDVCTWEMPDPKPEGWNYNAYAKIKGNIEKGKTYYISILPQTFENGFTLEFVIDGAKYTKSTTKATTIARNNILDLGTISFVPRVEEKKTVYFKPNDSWKADGAKFGAHFWSPDKDVVMTDADSDGIYEAEVPKTLENVIFVRLASDATGFGWGGYQTANLTVDNECFALDYAGNTGQWMTLEAAKTYVPEGPEAAKEGYIYLKPNANWLKDGARFAACFLGDPQVWVSMTATKGTEYFECEIPEGRTQVIFCRMNPGATENKWDNKYNQTGDLTIPTDGKNLYSVPEESWGGSGNEYWSTFE